MEFAPNRSTYHSGPTGTRALHDLLNESGYKVIRWRETPERLLSEAGNWPNLCGCGPNTDSLNRR